MINLLSHTLSVCTSPTQPNTLPTLTRTPPAWCRPSPKPQQGSNSAPLFDPHPHPQPLPTPPFFLPPRPAPDDAGWRGWRHASTGTPEERKGEREGGRDRREKVLEGIKKVGVLQYFLFAIHFFPSCLSFLHFSVHTALYERGFSECVFEEEGGGFGATTPSLNPPTPV